MDFEHIKTFFQSDIIRLLIGCTAFTIGLSSIWCKGLNTLSASITKTTKPRQYLILDEINIILGLFLIIRYFSH